MGTGYGADLPDDPRLPDDQAASGRSFGPEELAALAAVLESGTLTSTKGRWVAEAEAAFGAQLGVAHTIACASGSAAVHAAVAAVDPEPGDEIVTTPITDMGALTPILYQGAIPVFADVDPTTGNVTPESVAAVCSPRTRAIVATHLFGAPCAVEQIAALACERGLTLIEDCAQAFGARHNGRLVGTFGAFGCFSTQQGKHISTGEGGLLVAADAGQARRARRFVNKAWEYGVAETDHDFLALNYRMSELQGAVLRVQLDRLEANVARRRVCAAWLAEALAGVEGIALPQPPDGDEHSYWRVPVMVDPAVVPGGPAALAAAMALEGVSAQPRYIRKPAFRCGLFRDQRTFGASRWPFSLARGEALDYDDERFGGVYAFLERVLVLPWNERYEQRHVERVAETLRRAVATCRAEAA